MSKRRARNIGAMANARGSGIADVYDKDVIATALHGALQAGRSGEAVHLCDGNEVPEVLNDIIGLAKAIRASQLDWTSVRVAILKSRPASKRLNVGTYGHSKHSMAITREDVAIFMFDQISNRDFINKAPGISSR